MFWLATASSRSLPYGWQLAGLVISLVAAVLAVMALPTVFQMFGGKPKIEMRFESEESTDGQATRLSARLRNVPVTNRFLCGLGVTRSAHPSATPYLSIVRSGDQHVVIDHQLPEAFETRVDGDVRALDFHMESRLVGNVTVVCATHLHDNHATVVHDDQQNILATLDPGTYEVEVSVLAYPQRFFGVRTLSVTFDGAEWIGTKSTKRLLPQRKGTAIADLGRDPI